MDSAAHTRWESDAETTIEPLRLFPSYGPSVYVGAAWPNTRLIASLTIVSNSLSDKTLSESPSSLQKKTFFFSNPVWEKKIKEWEHIKNAKDTETLGASSITFSSGCEGRLGQECTHPKEVAAHKL